jgi:hypothetical protein
MPKKGEGKKPKQPTKYAEVIAWVFQKNYREGDRAVSFTRDELVEAHDALGLKRTKNIGDLPYSFRFRTPLPDEITRTAPKNSEWIILGRGTAAYEFRLASPGKVSPARDRERIPIFDATPEIVRKYAPGMDEQALLTRARYNRLVDLFLGLTCYSIQNHLRTSLPDVGQIEIDEIYLGVSKSGTHYVIPCQAKSRRDRFGIVQVIQDLKFCEAKYPNAICRPIAMQFQGPNEVALLELSVTQDEDVQRLNVRDEKHYRLCMTSEISEEQIRGLRDHES